MNGFKLLTIEYNGIYGIIDDYTSDSKIMNYLLKLKEGIKFQNSEVFSFYNSINMKIIKPYNNSLLRALI